MSAQDREKENNSAFRWSACTVPDQERLRQVGSSSKDISLK